LCVTLRKGRSDLPPLVCMLGVALYHPLAQALSLDRTVYGLHVPYGKKQSQGLTPSVEHVASLYLEAIRTQIPEGPYHLAGLCFGGIVAYEVARQLLAEGADVRTVSLFDAWLPRGVARDPKARLRALIDQARKDPSQAFGQVSTMASRLAEKVRSKLGPRFAVAAQPVEGQENGEDQALATLENDDLPVTGPLAASMLSAYDRSLRPIQRPMLLFRALDRTEPDWWTLDWDLGWGQVLDDVYVHPVEGSHLGILKAPHVHNIAIELDRAMLRSEQPLRKDSRPAPARSESSF
jgi:thioesterase domain-containing protein